jgi:hypothetical protein
MTNRLYAARCSRLILAFCLVTTAVAQSQEQETPEEQRRTADRQSSSQGPQSTLQPRKTGASVLTPGRLSRWERLRNAAWPFQARRPDTTEEPAPRRRWLLGRDVRYAPGQDPDAPQPSQAMADPAVSLAASEAMEDSKRSSASSASAPSLATGVVGVTDSIASQEGPRGPSPSLDALPPSAPGNPADRFGVPDSAAVSPNPAAPLPPPTPPSDDHPGTSGTNGAASEPSETPLTDEEEMHLHLVKRFFRWWPRTIEWRP